MLRTFSAMFAVLIMLASPLMPTLVAAQTPPSKTATPQLFVVTFRPGPAWVAGKPTAQQDLRAHMAYHGRLVREGRSVAAGGFVGVDGGMAILRVAGEAEAQAILAADPGLLNGVFASELRRWHPSFDSKRPLTG